MIRKAAIRKFLSRKLDNWDWVKKSTSAQLDAELPDLGLKLWQHQKAAFLLINELKRFMLHIDMGGGKTLLTLALIKHRKQCGEKPKAIVFVPFITSVETWVEECKKHTPDLRCVPLLGSGEGNLNTLTTDGDLFVICYQSAVAMLAETVYDGKTKRNKWKLTAQQVRDRFAGFNMLILDEVHKTKNVSSLTYRMCRALSAQCEWALGLTGTPFGRDLTDLWPQFYLIDFGETLGDTLGFYRGVFFRQKPNYWGGWEFQFKQRLLPDLKRIIKHSSIHYDIDEFTDMPPKEYIGRWLKPPEASTEYCKAAVTRINENLKKQGSFRIVESSYLQLRQLSSGFMTLKGEDNSRVQIKFADNPKLDALEELVDAMPHGCKMVVFHHFVYSNQLISDRLKQMKMPHARVWGGQKDKIGELRRFKDKPECRVLVINSRSGSSSLNLQLANYVVFFEQPDSPIDRQQAERRTWRPGQTKRVLYYDLFVRGTVDARMFKANKAGEDLLKALLSGSVKLK